MRPRHEQQDPQAPLRSSDLGRRFGLSADTIRHYERLGLLPGVARAANGYRRYPPETEERIGQIQAALAIGFTLRELAEVFSERDRGGSPCRRVRDLAAGKLAEVERAIERLADLRQALAGLLANWEARLAGLAPGERAHLLTHLPKVQGLVPTAPNPERLHISRRKKGTEP